MAHPKPNPLTPVPIQSVVVDDKFWSPKIAVWRATTINDAFDKFERGGAFENFDRVAARQKGGHKGEPWWDGLVYEMITGSADFLAARPDAKLQARIESYVARIAAAADADPDGYLNTGATLDGIGVRWRSPPAPGDGHNDNWPHTLYNAGALAFAARLASERVEAPVARGRGGSRHIHLRGALDHHLALRVERALQAREESLMLRVRCDFRLG